MAKIVAFQKIVESDAAREDETFVVGLSEQKKQDYWLGVLNKCVYILTFTLFLPPYNIQGERLK